MKVFNTRLLAEDLRVEMARRGQWQKEVAAECGVQASVISRTARNYQAPSAHSLAAILDWAGFDFFRYVMEQEA